MKQVCCLPETTMRPGLAAIPAKLRFRRPSESNWCNTRTDPSGWRSLTRQPSRLRAANAAPALVKAGPARTSPDVCVVTWALAGAAAPSATQITAVTRPRPLTTHVNPHGRRQLRTRKRGAPPRAPAPRFLPRGTKWSPVTEHGVELLLAALGVMLLVIAVSARPGVLLGIVGPCVLRVLLAIRLFAPSHPLDRSRSGDNE